MEPDQEGFSYPVVHPAVCDRCDRCSSVCPALHPRESIAAPAVFAAWNRNETIRLDSSSGGVFSVLADYVLEEGGAVFGAAMDGRHHLCHTACFRKEDLWRLRGSKYVQSDLQETFYMIQWALKTRRVLFVGTPCQVDGLYRYLGQRPETLITCDLVCRGVPSPGVWEDMADVLRRQRSMELRSVRFADKVAGWRRGYFTVVYADGTMLTKPFHETEYGRAFDRALFLRPVCHNCAYANLNRPGDFTLGDFWGLKADDLPDQQDRGVNLLLVNTSHASHIFDQLPLARQPFPLDQALVGNPNLNAPTPRPDERAAFFAAYKLFPFKEVYKRYLKTPPLPTRLANKILPLQIQAKLRLFFP